MQNPLTATSKASPEPTPLSFLPLAFTPSLSTAAQLTGRRGEHPAHRAAAGPPSLLPASRAELGPCLLSILPVTAWSHSLTTLCDRGGENVKLKPEQTGGEGRE